MIPIDMLRHITGFLRVADAILLENALAVKLYITSHYKSLLYKQSYSYMYHFNNRYIYIDTYRISDTVFSLVKPLPKSDFVIRHTDEISTKEANKKAYEALCAKESKALRRRFELTV